MLRHIFLKMLIDQNRSWICTDGEDSWSESSPNRRPLPCDCESLPAFGQQQHTRSAVMAGVSRS